MTCTHTCHLRTIHATHPHLMCLMTLSTAVHAHTQCSMPMPSSMPCPHPRPHHVWPAPSVHSCTPSSTPCLCPRPCPCAPTPSSTAVHARACLHMTAICGPH